MHHGFAFDIQAVCSGFVYALTTADLYLAGGIAKRVLVIGAETFSRILDWNDRTTCVLFGDGAGALVLEAEEGERHASPTAACSRASLRSDGTHQDKLYVDGGPVDHRHRRPSAHGGPRGVQACRRHDHRRGRSDASPTPASPPRTSTGSCRTRPTGASSTARPRSSASPTEKVVITVDRHGNTSAASVPLALAEAVARRAHQAAASWSCSRRWAAASPGARCCCAGSAADARHLDLARLFPYRPSSCFNCAF